MNTKRIQLLLATIFSVFAVGPIHAAITGTPTLFQEVFSFSLQDSFCENHLSVADVDGDGRQDIVLMATSYSEVSGSFRCRAILLHAEADGTFTDSIITDFPGQYGYGTVLADLNNDGAPDLILRETSTTHVLLNNGRGRFHEVWTGQPGYYSTVVVDVNHDGFLDIISGTQTGSGGLIEVFANDGTGTSFERTWQSRLYGSGYDSIETVLEVNLNNDGQPDIAAREIYSGLLVTLRGTPSGDSFVEQNVLALGDRTFALAGGRVNGDAVTDLAAYVGWGRVRVFLNQGNGSMADYWQSPDLGQAAFNLALADFDHDGFDDIFVGTFGDGALRIYRNDPGVGFGLWWQGSIPGDGYTGSVADLNGDGYPDLIVGERDRIRIFINRIGIPLFIGNATVTEGNVGTTNAAFTVSLLTNHSEIVSVDFVTVDGSATAGSDYFATSGTLIFNPGETTKAITVPVLGDVRAEANETFLVRLSNPTNISLVQTQVVGTILDDDIPPVIVTQPVSRTIFVGGSASFNVAASGTAPLGYQWQFNGANISGATSATLTLTNVQLTEAGAYLVIVTNAFGSVTSAVAQLTVVIPGLLDVWDNRDSGSAADLYGIAHRQGLFVTVGDAGAILTSTNGLNWINRSVDVSNELHGVASGDVFVAVGKSGAILTSVDGVAWTNRISGTTKSLKSVIHGNGVHVIVGGAGTILTSTDTVTWTSQISATAETLNAITHANGLFVAVGDGKNTNGTIVISTNGSDWTGAISGTGKNLRGVAYGNGEFIAVGNDGTILTSPDGTVWTDASSAFPCSEAGNLRGITFANGIFVAVGNFGALLTSPDGAVWTCRTSGTDNNLHNITYGNGRFVAVGSAGTIVINNPPRLAEMSVEQPLGTNLSDGESRDFGDVTVGSSRSQTFTIRNLGTANLTGLGITVDGPDGAMFSVTANPVAPVAPGGSTAFTVRFTPSSLGAKSGTLHIGNNDPDENPFDILLTGTCPLVTEAWVQRHDVTGYDVPSGLAVDASGNVVVSGSSGTLKYAADGTLLWQVSLGGAVAVDGSGNVVVSGFSGTLKYAADGTLLWQVGISGAVAVDGSGNVVVTGSAGTWKYAGVDGSLLWQAGAGSVVAVGGGGDVVVAGQSYNGADYDFHTAKYAAANGALMWEQRYNGPAVPAPRLGRDIPRALAVDGSGNVVVTGYSSNAHNDDWYTAKYAAANGALLWEKRYNGPANRDDHANAVAVDGDGNVVVTGYSASGSIVIGLYYDWYTAKYAEADGTLLWERRRSGGEASAVALDGNGNVVVTGFTGGGGSQKYCTAKYAAADGALLWEKLFVGPEGGPDFAFNLALGPYGMIAIAGQSSGHGTGYDYATVVYRDSLSPVSTLPPLSIEKTPCGVRLRFTATISHGYKVQRAPALIGPWSTIATVTALAPGLIEFHDTNAPPGSAFYRTATMP